MNEESTTNALSLIAQSSNGTAPDMPRREMPTLTRSMDEIERIYRIAAAYSRSNMVAPHYQGGKDSAGHANCFLVITMAEDLGLSHALALQHITPVKGKAAIDGQLAIGLIKKRAPIKGPIKYKIEGEGEDKQCTATVIDRETGEEVSYTLTKKQARQAGWYNSEHSYWHKNEDLMFMYRSATYLARVNYPEVLMGLYTSEEIADMKTAEQEQANSAQSSEIKELLQVEAVEQEEEISSEQEVKDESAESANVVDPSGEVVE